MALLDKTLRFSVCSLANPSKARSHVANSPMDKNSRPSVSGLSKKRHLVDSGSSGSSSTLGFPEDLFWTNFSMASTISYFPASLKRSRYTLAWSGFFTM